MFRWSGNSNSSEMLEMPFSKTMMRSCPSTTRRAESIISSSMGESKCITEQWKRRGWSIVLESGIGKSDFMGVDGPSFCDGIIDNEP